MVTVVEVPVIRVEQELASQQLATAFKRRLL